MRRTVYRVGTLAAVLVLFASTALPARNDDNNQNN